MKTLILSLVLVVVAASPAAAFRGLRGNVHDPLQTALERIQFNAHLQAWAQQQKDLQKVLGFADVIQDLKNILNFRYGSPESAAKSMHQIDRALDLLDNLPQVENVLVLEKDIKGILAITRSNDVFASLPDKVGEHVISRNTAEYRSHAILGRRIDQYEVERKMTTEYAEQSAERLEEVMGKISGLNTRTEQWAGMAELASIEAEDLLMRLRMKIRMDDSIVQSLSNDNAAMVHSRFQSDVAAGSSRIQQAVSSGATNSFGVTHTNNTVYTPSGQVGSKAFSDSVSGLNISKAGIDLIIEFEVGGVSYYNSRLKKPTYPGGASGVTIGIGYDLGYNTKAAIAKDWGDQVSPAILARLQAVAGLKRGAASARISGMRDIAIPYEAALAVYYKRTLPRFAKLTQSTFPKTEILHGDSQGSLTSLVYNRGSSLKGERRREMRQIRAAVLSGNTGPVPGYFRSMKRIWAGTSVGRGLIRRREAEAQLFKG